MPPWKAVKTSTSAKKSANGCFCIFASLGAAPSPLIWAVRGLKGSFRPSPDSCLGFLSRNFLTRADYRISPECLLTRSLLVVLSAMENGNKRMQPVATECKRMRLFTGIRTTEPPPTGTISQCHHSSLNHRSAHTVYFVICFRSAAVYLVSLRSGTRTVDSKYSATKPRWNAMIEPYCSTFYPCDQNV